MSLNYMPAEWQTHYATIMIFPERAGSWSYGGKKVLPVFCELAKIICGGERVFLAVSKKSKRAAEELFKEQISAGQITLWQVKTDDCWARDIAPTFIKRQNELLGVDWSFNGWGGSYNGLYPDYKNDDKFASFVCKKLRLKRINAHPFVLEGGSIHSDGKGTILTTKECLLSKGRNPGLTQGEIEQKLKFYLGAERVIWLPWGCENDETDGHVDNICAFCSPDTALLCYGESGERLRRFEENEKVLREAGIKVVPVPYPKEPVTVKEEDLKGLTFAKGEAARSLGEPLAASYINFYVCNAGVLVPQFGDENDEKALKILHTAFPAKTLFPFPAEDIIVGGGNIHCLTQQIPL